jgi:hypothetical protein
MAFVIYNKVNGQVVKAYGSLQAVKIAFLNMSKKNSDLAWREDAGIVAPVVAPKPYLKSSTSSDTINPAPTQTPKASKKTASAVALGVQDSEEGLLSALEYQEAVPFDNDAVHTQAALDHASKTLSIEDFKAREVVIKAAAEAALRKRGLLA